MTKIIKLLKLDIDYSKRIFGLDIIRAFAILSVVHLHLYIANTLISSVKSTQKTFVPLIDGVDVFFVLSGFLIGGILIDNFEKKITRKSLLRFWIMRWMRTLPNYYVWATILLGIAFLTGSRQNPLIYYFFVQNFYINKIKVFNESWSLSVEEWFYLLFPLCALVLLRISKLKFQYVFLIVVLLYLALSVSVAIDYFDLKACSADNFIKLRGLVVYRLNSIGIGVLAILTKKFYPAGWSFLKKRFVFFVMLLIYVTTIVLGSIYSIFETKSLVYYMYFVHIYVSAVAVACLIAYIEDVETDNMMIKKIITYISVLSYSMYLIHGSFLMIILVVIFKGLKLNSFLLYFVVYVVLLYILCITNYKMIELRFMNKRAWVIKRLNLE